MNRFVYIGLKSATNYDSRHVPSIPSIIARHDHQQCKHIYIYIYCKQ